GAGVPEEPELAGRVSERQHDRILLPHGVGLPHLRQALGEALLGGEPDLHLLLPVPPLDEVLGELLVLRVAHDAVVERRVVREGPAGPAGSAACWMSVCISAPVSVLYFSLFL